MEFQGFENEDFEVFEVPGLELRMDALKAHLRPKLTQLGHDFEKFLGIVLNQSMFAHVARHARRTVNAPNDSWVAFCQDKRGYKKHPHFQIGAWQTHIFATFGLIYESPMRHAYADALIANADEIVRRIPGNYVYIPNHMDTTAVPAAEVDAKRLGALARKMATGHQGELLVGLQIPKYEAVGMTAEELEQAIQNCFMNLLPLYRLANSEQQEASAF